MFAFGFFFCCCFFSSLSSVVSVCVFLLSALVVSVHLVVCRALDMVLCRGWLLGIFRTCFDTFILVRLC